MILPVVILTIQGLPGVEPQDVLSAPWAIMGHYGPIYLTNRIAGITNRVEKVPSRAKIFLQDSHYKWEHDVTQEYASSNLLDKVVRNLARESQFCPYTGA